jgi:hypothetical protein
MKTCLLLCFAAMASPTWAAYTYYQDDSFSSINTANWYVNGSVLANPGLVSAGGGAVISKLTVPPGEAYEMKMTLNMPYSGTVRFITYLRASQNTQPSSGSGVQYFSVELTPTVTSDGCTGTLSVYRHSDTSHALAGSTTIACYDGMNIRSVIYNAGSVANVFVFNDGNLVMDVWGLQQLPLAGRPGVGTDTVPGGGTTPMGAKISRVEIGGRDWSVPQTISSGSVSTWIDSTQVDVQWTGVLDDQPNGIGLWAYGIWRYTGACSGGSVFLGYTRKPSFTDAGLSPGTAYCYTISAFDYHLNQSDLNYSLTTTTGAQSLFSPTAPVRTGVRPLGVYWGAGSEQIDLFSGNLNWSQPVLKATTRGWSVPFGLSYNSQMWKKNSAGTWFLGEDVGFGLGWRLMAGSISPHWGDATQIQYWIYTDSTGAEYKLNVYSGGFWSSREGIYVEYDSTNHVLYFADGSFWEMKCVSADDEADVGTRYPTKMQDSNGNQILVRYNRGLGGLIANSSARIKEIEDIRAIQVGNTY